MDVHELNSRFSFTIDDVKATTYFYLIVVLVGFEYLKQFISFQPHLMGG